MSIDTQAYLFVHFIGEERNPTDEQLYFALSRAACIGGICARPAVRR